MEISFLPGKISSLTLSVLIPSVLTNNVGVHVHISVQVLVEAHAVEQWVLLLGSIIVFLTLVPIVLPVLRFMLLVSYTADAGTLG